MNVEKLRFSGIYNRMMEEYDQAIDVMEEGYVQTEFAAFSELTFVVMVQ